MTIINLRDFYPFYVHDVLMEVPDPVAAILLEAERAEEAHRLRVYRNRAYYSLDVGDGIERDALLLGLSALDMYERRMEDARLSIALARLSVKQRQRVHAHFYLGMSKAAIARAESVSETTVRRSIACALRKMKIFLKKL